MEPSCHSSKRCCRRCDQVRCCSTSSMLHLSTASPLIPLPCQCFWCQHAATIELSSPRAHLTQSSHRARLSQSSPRAHPELTSSSDQVHLELSSSPPRDQPEHIERNSPRAHPELSQHTQVSCDSMKPFPRYLQCPELLAWRQDHCVSLRMWFRRRVRAFVQRHRRSHDTHRPRHTTAAPSSASGDRARNHLRRCARIRYLTSTPRHLGALRHRLFVIVARHRCSSSVVRHRLFAIGCSSSVVRHRLFAIGIILLCYCKKATSDFRKV